MNQIDLGRALKAFFEDKQWVNKTLLGFLWIALGVTAPAAYGAQVEYIKGVSEGNETLPTWDNFGDKWVKGFLVVVAGFIYFLPVIIGGAILFVPAVIAAAGSGDSDAWAGLFAGGTCVFTLFAIVYGVSVSLFFSAAMTNYAMKGTFGAMFEFGEIMGKVRGNTGYFTAWMWALVISMIGSTVASVLSATGVGAILMPAVSYFMMMASGHVFGQWAARAYGRPAAPGQYTAPPSFAPPAPPAYAPPAQPEPPAYAPPAQPEPPAYAPPEAPAPPAPPAPPYEG